MKIQEKYLEALKTFDEFVMVSEWASKFGEMYPDLLEKANKEAENQKNDTTGLRELSARIASKLATDRFNGQVQVDTNESPRKVKYITPEELEQNTTHDIQEDLEPITRREIEKQAEDKLALKELYRLDELRNIQKAFKTFFAIDFEVDHAKALLHKTDKGQHHPDNFQLILKHHNAKKNNSNWKRFSIDEQLGYIKQAVKLQSIVADRFNVDIDEQILNSLVERLKQVY